MIARGTPILGNLQLSSCLTILQVQSMVQQLMDANGQLPTGVATSTTLTVPCWAVGLAGKPSNEFI